MNYTRIYWKEKLLNYSTNIALGKMNVSDSKIKSIINILNNEIDIIYYTLLLIVIFSFSFIRTIKKINIFYIPEILNILIYKPHFTFMICYLLSDYITKIIPFVPTYYLTSYIVFSFIIFFRMSN